MKAYFIALLVVCVFLAGCQNLSATKIVVATDVVEISEIAETAMPPLSTSDKVVCPTTVTLNKTDNVANGRMLYVDYNNYDILSFDIKTTDTHSLIKKSDKMISYALSPSGEWLAYEATNMDNKRNQLVITRTNIEDDQQEIRIDWETDWDKVAYWLNNDHLIIKLFPDENYRVLLLNLFSKERQELIANFPNIYSLDAWPPDWNGSGQFIYNSDLSRVIYGDTNQRFVMWDVINSRQLSQLQAFTFRQFPSKAPQWNSDGSQAVVAAPEKSLDYMNDELFSINQDGQIKKLTNLNDFFSSVSINRYSWSPDYRFIAMLVSVTPGDYVEQLVVFDTYTQKQTVFCIEGDASITNSVGYRRSPSGFFDEIIYRGVVWSPDSQQIIVENRIAENTSRIIIINLSDQMAYELLDRVNYEPIGWVKYKN